MAREPGNLDPCQVQKIGGGRMEIPARQNRLQIQLQLAALRFFNKFAAPRFLVPF